MPYRTVTSVRQAAAASLAEAKAQAPGNCMIIFSAIQLQTLFAAYVSALTASRQGGIQRPPKNRGESCSWGYARPLRTLLATCRGALHKALELNFGFN